MLQGNTFGSRIGKYLMKFLLLRHTLHLKLVGFGVTFDFSTLFSIALEVKQFLRVRHFQTLASHIVLIRSVIDAADIAAPHCARFGPVVV